METVKPFVVKDRVLFAAGKHNGTEYKPGVLKLIHSQSGSKPKPLFYDHKNKSAANLIGFVTNRYMNDDGTLFGDLEILKPEAISIIQYLLDTHPGGDLGISPQVSGTRNKLTGEMIEGVFDDFSFVVDPSVKATLINSEADHVTEQTMSTYVSKEMKAGIKVEAEHKETFDKIAEYVKKLGKLPPYEEMQKWIAENHIVEIPDYYERLQKMEHEAKESESKEVETHQTKQEVKEMVEQKAETKGPTMEEIVGKLQASIDSKFDTMSAKLTSLESKAVELDSKTGKIVESENLISKLQSDMTKMQAEAVKDVGKAEPAKESDTAVKVNTEDAKRQSYKNTVNNSKEQNVDEGMLDYLKGFNADIL